MKYMRHSALALLFVASTVAHATSGNTRAAPSPGASHQTSTVSSARSQSANTASTATASTANRAYTAVQTQPTYHYQGPAQPSTGSVPQVVQSTSSSSSRYKFTEVAPRSLW